jgi:mycothiol system anti-sigma-R factor
MTDCGCDKDLEEYLHNELCKEDAADIREHLANCPSCTHEHHVGIVLTEVVQRACKETAPDDLRQQILVKLRSIQSTHVVVD